MDKISKFDKPIISLTFDDGWKSIYNNAIPILDKNNLLGTFFIISTRFDNPSYMTVAEVLETNKKGHEIGAHSRNHINLQMCPRFVIKKEINGSADDLIKIGVDSIRSFAYPYGRRSDRVKSIAKEMNIISARSVIGDYCYGDEDRYDIPTKFVIQETKIEDVKGWIDKAIAEKLWLVLLFHQIAPDAYMYGCSIDIFSQIIDYIKGKNVDVMRYSDVITKYYL